MFRTPRLGLLLIEPAIVVLLRHDPNLLSVQLQRLALRPVLLVVFADTLLPDHHYAITLADVFGQQFALLVPHGDLPPCGAIVTPISLLVLLAMRLRQREPKHRCSLSGEPQLRLGDVSDNSHFRHTSPS